MIPVRALPDLIAASIPAAASGDPGAASVESAWTMFATLASLLAVFTITVAVLALLRLQRRGPGTTPRREEPETNAWEEAGRRARAFPDRNRRAR